MKKILLLVLPLLLFSVSWGQHFEWAKGFGTGYPQNGECHITGTVTDSFGNLYILGQFSNDSEWDGERLLPMTPYGPRPDNINTLIAKISPSGKMLWKKVLHSNNGSVHLPNDIKKVGDTAFACMVQMTLPTDDNYTYYLDTLLQGYSDYPVNGMYVRLPLRTALIMFDFEGNVLEQHFLYVTYTDTAGNDYVRYFNNDPTPWYSNYFFQNSSFDIDNDGNIYISYEALNYIDTAINAQNGAIKGVKFWVDSTNVGHFTFENRPPMWYPLIVKFSPHFDTMLACRFVVQKHGNTQYVINGTQTYVDKYENVYFLPHIYRVDEYTRDTIIIDSIQSIFIEHADCAVQKEFLVQFNSNLIPNWIITLDDSVISSGPMSVLAFANIAFDYDSNLMFLSGETSRATFLDTINFYSILTYRGTPLNIGNDAFFMTFNIGNTIPELYSYGRIPAISSGSGSTGNIFCKNNRLFFQCVYYGGVHFPNNDIHFSSIYEKGIGLIIFDYQGNVIGGLDYESFSPDSYPGPISLHDSVLYLTGQLYSNAIFGDIDFITNERQYAYIAQYIDTAFMSPYVRQTNSSIPQIIDKQTSIYPNPTYDKITLYPLCELITEVAAISASGIRTKLMLNGDDIKVSNLQPGIYILEIVTPKNKYHYKFIKL